MVGALAVLLPALVKDYGDRMVAAAFASLTIIPLAVVLAQRDGMDNRSESERKENL